MKKRFSQIGILNLHRYTVAVHEGKKSHKCSICEKSFSQKGSLKLHNLPVHEGNKPHKCSFGETTFSLFRKFLAVHEGKKYAICSLIEDVFQM